MSCPSCVGHLDDVLRAVAGVAGVDVQLENGKIIIEHDPRRAPIDQLISAVREAGYSAAESR